MFEIEAKLDFRPENVTKKHNRQSSWKHVAIAKLEKDDTHLYYAWLLERRFNLPLVQPLRGSHITIISDIMDDNFGKTITKRLIKKKLEEMKIEFTKEEFETALDKAQV